MDDTIRVYICALTQLTRTILSNGFIAIVQKFFNSRLAKRESLEGKMRLAVFVLSFFGCSSPSLASSDWFWGTWAAGGEAGGAILGEVVITATGVSWDGSNVGQKCHTTYKVVDRTEGPHPFPDQGLPFSQIPSEATYKTVKIRLTKAKCLGLAAFFRLAVPSDNSRHLDVVMYNNLDQPAGWFAFYRVK